LFGDFVADEFQYGEITRVSREAPVLILRHRQTEVVPGGGANAANNLAALGARISPVTRLATMLLATRWHPIFGGRASMLRGFCA